MMTLWLSAACAALAPKSAMVRVLAMASVPAGLTSSANSSLPHRGVTPVTWA